MKSTVGRCTEPSCKGIIWPQTIADDSRNVGRLQRSEREQEIQFITAITARDVCETAAS